MAVTITPQDLGTQEATSADLSTTAGQDPTYVEADVLPVLILFINLSNADSTVQVISQSTREEPPYGLGGPGFFTVPQDEQAFHLMIQKKLSDFVVDFGQSPPIVEFQGGDLTNLQIAAVKFNAL